MVIPNRTLYVLSFAAALCLASAWLPLTGCAKKTGQEAAPETSDTLSAIADTLPQTPVPLTDGRDGKTYRTVAIGGKTWMAENLNYQTVNSWCYEHDNSNCNKYGRLYTWNAAKVACPTGWHLPTVQEWDNLSQAAGGVRKSEKIDSLGYVFYWDGAGKHLKASSGWSDYQGASGNGTDDFGFSALPGSSRFSDGSFGSAGNLGVWWTATEDDASYAYNRSMYYYYDDVHYGGDSKEVGLSVRCVGD